MFVLYIMIIAFEGPAFCGKTLCIDFFESKFLCKKIPEVVVKEADLTYDICKDNEIQKNQLIKKNMKHEKNVFIDRSYISTWVYVQLAKHYWLFDKVKDYADWFSQKKKDASLIKPDIYLLFYIKKNVGLFRGKWEKRYKNSLIWYKNLSLTYKIYEKLINQEKNSKLIKINANANIADVIKQIQWVINQ